MISSRLVHGLWLCGSRPGCCVLRPFCISLQSIIGYLTLSLYLTTWASVGKCLLVFLINKLPMTTTHAWPWRVSFAAGWVYLHLGVIDHVISWKVISTQLHHNVINDGWSLSQNRMYFFPEGIDGCCRHIILWNTQFGQSEIAFHIQLISHQS